MNEIAQVRAFLAEFLGPADTPVSVRVEKSRAFAEAAVTPEGVAIEAGELAGVPVEWVVPAGAGAAPLFLHLHGGGYVMGDPAGSRPFTTQHRRPATEIGIVQVLELVGGLDVTNIEQTFHLLPQTADQVHLLLHTRFVAKHSGLGCGFRRVGRVRRAQYRRPYPPRS